MRNTIKRLMLVATTLVAGLAISGASAHAGQLDFVPGSVTGQTSSTQAGSHADFRTSFELTRDEFDNPASSPKLLTNDLPPGFLGNPLATPTCLFDRVNDPLGQNGPPCPRNTAVGEVTFTLRVVSDKYDWGPFTALLYNVPPSKGQPAAFGFFALVQPVRLDVGVEPNGDYNVRTSLSNISEAQPLISADVRLWGVPADHQGPGDKLDYLLQPYGAPLENEPRKPFMTLPSVCDGQPLKTVYNAVPWDPVGLPAPETTALAPALIGCDQQVFEPAIDVRPSSKVAGAPSGYDVDLTVPQNDDPDGLATPPLKDAVVTLPAGTAISPTAADGLGSCSDAQLGLKSKELEDCPLASKIGTVNVDTPLLAEPLEGSMYIGKQLSDDPESGQMYRLFVTAASPRYGVRVKLRGEIRADKKTGQVTATFKDNPQLPFSKFSMHFKGGDRAPLVNPSACGTHTTTGSLSSWGGQQQAVSSSFVIDEGCPTDRFAPTFKAGTTNPLGGGFSPFTMTVARSDADQNLANLKLDLPSGLLGALGSVPLCPEDRAAAGTCGADSRIGSTTVSVGSGGAPFTLGGTVSLGGPYKGAPFSLSVAIPAKAGPFDLGMVVVRTALHVDATRAKATAVTDPFPTIVGGVPISMRTVSITLDRPGFMFNATSCEASAIGGTFGGVGGGSASGSVTYQPRGCNRLPLRPKLALKYTDKSQLRKGKHPGVQANLDAVLGDANMKTVKVTLPLTASLDPKNARALCSPEGAAARNCPEESQIGWASATTPTLHEPVQGPVYFVKGTRISETGRVVDSLPKLYLKLEGEGVTVDLNADSDVDKQSRLVTTFTAVPDVPINDFRLQINSGEHGILKATNDVCGASKGTTVEFTGHNGAVTQREIRFTAPDCKPQVVTSANSRNTRLAVRIGGIGAGKLTLTGKGLRKVTRTIKQSDTALLRPRFSAAINRTLRQGRTVRVAVRVTYAPKQGKKVTIRKTVAVRGVRS